MAASALRPSAAASEISTIGDTYALLRNANMSPIVEIALAAAEGRKAGAAIDLAAELGLGQQR